MDSNLSITRTLHQMNYNRDYKEKKIKSAGLITFRGGYFWNYKWPQLFYFTLEESLALDIQGRTIEVITIKNNQDFTLAIYLFRTRVVRASPSTSSATITRGFLCVLASSSAGTIC